MKMNIFDKNGYFAENLICKATVQLPIFQIFVISFYISINQLKKCASFWPKSRGD